MKYKHNPANVPAAKALRKHMTPEERHLWYDFLRGYPVRILRQRPIGPYIVDFYCAAAKLVIELDGSQHYEPEGQEHDAERTAFLEQYGLKVIRISNRDVNRNFNGVCELLHREIQSRLPGSEASLV